MTDDEIELMKTMHTEFIRLKHHNDALLMTTFHGLLTHLRKGNVDFAIEILESMHDEYKNRLVER